ncbi:hypothetical protein ADUPG1_010931 [Aduncisulcus paluster]|uniref:Secreted protein n=1 Tax=Aduncisulcus paluster TaxID=2918883 RepID=A0ABQ5JTF7_9EUKA|nr:hypothetical protein ADUPG1_010931 [Aduncisulcus paluster]
MWHGKQMARPCLLSFAGAVFCVLVFCVPPACGERGCVVWVCPLKVTCVPSSVHGTPNVATRSSRRPTHAKRHRKQNCPQGESKEYKINVGLCM